MKRHVHAHTLVLALSVSALLLIAIGAGSCASTLSPENQELVQAIENQKSEVLKLRQQLAEERAQAASAVRETEDQLQSKIAELQRAIAQNDSAAAGAIRDLLAALEAKRDEQAQALAEVEKRMELLEELLRSSDQAKEAVLAKDAGEKTGAALGLLELLLAGLGAGGAGAGLLQRLTPSRASKDVQALREKVAEQAARIDTLIGSFQSGLSSVPTQRPTDRSQS